MADGTRSVAATTHHVKLYPSFLVGTPDGIPVAVDVEMKKYGAPSTHSKNNNKIIISSCGGGGGSGGGGGGGSATRRK